MENNTFTYQYSARQNEEAENIRSKYLPRKISNMELLRKLDIKARTAGRLQGLIIGIIGTLVFGVGMCFGLDVFKSTEWVTILLCTAGILIMIPAYPIYKHISKKTKAELTPEILRLSEKIMRS